MDRTRAATVLDHSAHPGVCHLLSATGTAQAVLKRVVWPEVSSPDALATGRSRLVSASTPGYSAGQMVFSLAPAMATPMSSTIISGHQRGEQGYEQDHHHHGPYLVARGSMPGPL